MSDDRHTGIDGEHRPFQDAFLDNMVGDWDVRSTVVGQPLRHRCRAAWVLNHQFLRIHFEDATPRPRRGPKAGGDPPYEAFVFIGYDNMSERYVVHWLDGFGGRSSETLGFGGRVRRNGANASITFVFEGPSGPLHNILSWNSRTKRWTMVIRQKDGRGVWSTFATETFERRTPP